MSKKLTTAVIVIVVVIAGAGGVYLYLIQPSKPPSQDAQSAVQRLPESNTPSQKVLHIVSGESKATYELNEVLRGTATHVVGSTGDIAGDISLTLSNPQTIQLGEIKVNARTLKTDIEMRDNNVRKLVLKSDEPANEFIVFKTTSITGVPATIELNKDFSIAITGDVTIAGVTKSVTFDGNAKLSSDNSLIINANTMVKHEDFGVFVPDFPFLANVDKVTKLSIALIAR